MRRTLGNWRRENIASLTPVIVEREEFREQWRRADRLADIATAGFVGFVAGGLFGPWIVSLFI